MKKKTFITAVILAVIVICMAGCGTGEPTLSLDIQDEKTAEIVLNKADPDDFVMAGTIDVAEGEILEFIPEMEDGSEISVKLTAVSEEQNENDFPEDGEADYEVTLKNSERSTSVVDSGSYMLKVTALSKSNGKVSLQVKAAE